MQQAARRATPGWRRALPVVLVAAAVTAVSAGTTQAGPSQAGPKFTEAVAFDVSKPLRELAKQPAGGTLPSATGKDTDSEPAVLAGGTNALFSPLASLTGSAGQPVNAQVAASAIPGPLANFEGLSNQDNFNVLGFRVNPPDPVGDVGPNHYVEMINLVFGVYSKTGTLLLGPADIGSLWAGFAVPDCTDQSGDPVVLYDQLADRWLLTQFTTSGWPTGVLELRRSLHHGRPDGAVLPLRLQHGAQLPGLPEVRRLDGLVRHHDTRVRADRGIRHRGVRPREEQDARRQSERAASSSFFIDGNDPDLLPLVGDGLLPADIDGKQKPKNEATIPLVGTQDDDYVYGATFDALNIWELDVKWRVDPDCVAESRDSAARRGVRFELPVRTDVP